MAHTEPVTEMGNPLSQDIDLQSAQGIVRTLEACDLEIFNGFTDSSVKHQSIYSDAILDAISAVSTIAASIIENTQDSLIVLSGCGTSGRLAFLTARTVNEWLASKEMRPHLDYIIAAGDRALFTSQESQEDDYKAGIAALEKMCSTKRRVLFIGISCGVSAPFVAGQLDYCLQHLEIFTPVLIGFNPEEAARRTPIRDWNKTFYDVVCQMKMAAKEGKAYLINPIVGPEAVRGSSRMKGGSATMMILGAIFVPRWLHEPGTFTSARDLTCNVIKYFQGATECIYLASDTISPIISLAAASLMNGGRVIYLGAGTTGIMAMIDASECVPTYGVSRDSFRGYLRGGYSSLGNKEGDLSILDSVYSISLEYFLSEQAPTLGTKDLVIAIHLPEQEAEVREALYGCCAQKIACRLVLVDAKPSEPLASEPLAASARSGDLVRIERLPVLRPGTVGKAASRPGSRGLLQSYLLQYATKLFCNAVSTGSHILAGKVYKNVMVDLRVSNGKLFERALGIIEEIGGCSRDEALRYLSCSIRPEADCGRPSDWSNSSCPESVSALVELAAKQSKVVPTALTMALTGLQHRQVVELLSDHPSIRSCIARYKPA